MNLEVVDQKFYRICHCERSEAILVCWVRLLGYVAKHTRIATSSQAPPRNDKLWVIFASTLRKAVHLRVGGFPVEMNGPTLIGTPFLLTGTPFLLSKMTFTLTGMAFLLTGMAFLLTGMAFLLTGTPFLLIGMPFLLNGMPFLLTGTPSLLTGTPFTLSGRRYSSSSVLRSFESRE